MVESWPQILAKKDSGMCQNFEIPIEKTCISHASAPTPEDMMLPMCAHGRLEHQIQTQSVSIRCYSGVGTDTLMP